MYNVLNTMGHDFDRHRRFEQVLEPRRERFNFYEHPGPVNKDQKRLDATQLTIHTDEVVRKVCVRQPCRCCPPERALFANEKRSYIISATTQALEPNTYYTLQIDRETPIEAFGLDTYINVEPQGFFRGEVGLNFSRLVHKGKIGGDLITGEHEELDSLGVEGRLDDIGAEGALVDEHFDHGRFGCAGLIPKDPSHPAQDFVGCGFHSRNGVLVPVILDLLGNIANGKNFSTGRFAVPGVGRPYNNRFVLYYNNNGKFVLTRDWRRRSDYA